MTVALTTTACGPPMIIFPGNNVRTIIDLAVPDYLCIVSQEKAWKDRCLMMVWYEKNMAEMSAQKNKTNRFSQVLNSN